MSTAPWIEQLSVVGASGGPLWLARIRSEAATSLRNNGFPTTRNEDWHFTSPAPIIEAGFGPMPDAENTTTVAEVARVLDGAPYPVLVFVNGRYTPSLSAGVPSVPHGVRIMSLATALLEEPTLVERYLGRIAGFDTQALAFTALNTAMIRDGVVIHAGPGTSGADTPIHVLYLTDAAAAGGSAAARTLIVAEEGARIAVIEQYAALAQASCLTNAVTEVVTGPGATVQHYRLQRESRQTFHVGHVEARLDRDAHFESFSYVTGGALSRINIYATLGGEGSGATLNGLYMLDGTQVCDHQTRIEHASPNTFSRELYKGILDATSHGVFNGKVYVRPIAQKTDGRQTNKTLLLSERARVDTKPQLEIFADDVKCTHGATVGRLDESAEFYLRSRGVSAENARRLLTWAFAADVLETIAFEGLRTGLEALAMRRFVDA
ncbi:MAG: Fe-S cluster assembly protein SufD [Gemmatimonadota bacterium]